MILSACTDSNVFTRIGQGAVAIELAQTCPASAAFTPGVGFDGSVNMIWSDPSTCWIYVSGDFTHFQGSPVGHLVRLFPNGTLDYSFADGTGPNNHLSAIVPMADGSGRLYLGGNFTTYNGQALPYLVRIFPSGFVDPSFNLGTGLDGIVFRILVPNDGTGQLYVIGDFTHVNGTAMGRMVRLASDGSIDTSFSIGQGFDALVQNMDLAPQDNSLVYAAGDFTHYQGVPANHLIRLHHDGTVDSTFNVGSGFTFIAASAYGLIATDDGSNRIYVSQGGDPVYPTAPTYQGARIAPGITRINSDGSIDNTFQVGTGFTSPPNSPSGVYNVTMMGDGSHRIYASGYFSQYNGVVANNFARLNPDGTLDTTFNVGSGFSGPTFFAFPANPAATALYVFGNFLDFNGQAMGSIVRVDSSGGLN